MSGWLPASTSLTIGCSSSVSRPGRPEVGPAASARMRRAAACAKLALPTPFGPASSHAWWSLRDRPGVRELPDGAILADDHGSRSAMASSRRWVTSSGAAGSIDQFDPLRLLGGDQAKGELDLVMIIVGTAADAVASVRIPRSRPLGAFVEAEHERAIGEPLADSECVDCAHDFDTEAAAAALIGKGAVDEPVGQHPFARFERRTDHLVDMIAPRGREQQGLRRRAPAGFVAGQ